MGSEMCIRDRAMILGTAGFTSLLCAFAIKAREELLLGEKVNDVLVTGATGGVGSMAVMILSKFGYNVTAVTGKKDKTDYLKQLGAKNIIDRKEFEGESKLLEKGFLSVSRYLEISLILLLVRTL